MKELSGSNLTTLYYQYKGTKYSAIAIFIVVTLLSLLLIILFVIPQIQNWLVSNAEVEEMRERVAALNTNITFLENIDGNTVDTDFQNVTTALPIDKDFGGAMQQIVSSAITSGVQLRKFSFAVGDVGSKSATPKIVEITPLQIEVTVLGDAVNIKDFIASLAERIPFSQVLSAVANSSGGETNITILFPNDSIKDATFDKTSPITAYTPKQRQVLDQISVWKDNASILLEDSTGSSAGALSEPPF